MGDITSLEYGLTVTWVCDFVTRFACFLLKLYFSRLNQTKTVEKSLAMGNKTSLEYGLTHTWVYDLVTRFACFLLKLCFSRLNQAKTIEKSLAMGDITSFEYGLIHCKCFTAYLFTMWNEARFLPNKATQFHNRLITLNPQGLQSQLMTLMALMRGSEAAGHS
jgi:hypothetical protein